MPDDIVGGRATSRTVGGAPLRDRRTGDMLTPRQVQRMERVLQQAFAPMHKAAFGVAIGTVLAAVFALATLADLAVDPLREMGLGLLGQYFYGYTVSPVGALVGLAWGFVVGFVAGWFLAFARNAVTAIWILYIRARADWKATHDFLDYV